ncbi:C-type mannose receptor 2-like [Trachinotus anak]|uniref:C-type mannose receptor 2-like n=1 Tax=Trachinotus anak TaxID=443729 RepID=UPI0039F1C75B
MRYIGTVCESKGWNLLRMMMTLLFVFALTGLSAVTANIFRMYHYVNMSKTWDEAQSYCRDMFTDLATVTSKDENRRMLSVTQGLEDFVWIGLYDDLTKWKWSLDSKDFNGKKDFSSWDESQPDNRLSSQHCVTMSPQGTWNDAPCEQNLRYAVCYTGHVPSPYALVPIQMTWSQARVYCISMYRDLASVTTLSQNNQIASMLETNTWIGLYRSGWDYWSDSTPTSFTNWHTGQPDNSGYTMQSCVAVNTTAHTWWDVDCNEKHYFVCQKTFPLLEGSSKALFKLKVKSEADLKDPALQQQILEQLHAKLKKRGIPDFKLRWIQTDEQTFHKEQKRKEEEGISLPLS